MPTTSNFGWTTPADTDLVKDGAAAIRTLGNGIDTSFLDLKGGTTGQVLSKASNTDLDFSWVAQDDSNAIQNAIVDAKGDLISATAADTPARLAVGANGTVLTADSAEATGLKWTAPSAGSLTLITPTSTANSGGTVTTSGAAVTASGVNSVSLNGVFSATYEDYVIIVDNIKGNTTDDFALRFRASGTDNTGASNYKYAILYGTDGGVAGAAGSTGQSYAFVFEVTNVTDASLGAVINVWNPFNSATITSFASTHRRTAASGLTTGRTVATGSFDGITFTDAALGRTFSGTIRVYGYSK